VSREPQSPSSGTITVIGIGPGADEHVTVDTLTQIEQIGRRHLRTSVHPSAHLVLDAPGGAVTHDDLYESADTFADVYAEIAERLLADAAAHGHVLYAVPGSPLVLERTVRTLRQRAAATDADFVLDVRPAMSFLDVAWAKLGIDPVEAGVRLVDGHEFAIAAADQTGPLLVAHTHANWVLSDIKLAVEGATGDEAVVILHALGTDEERIVETVWADLDRTVEANHLTSIYIPHLAAPVGHHYTRFHELTRTLREKCPWDVEQTHESLIPYLLEETYEVVDALQALGGPEQADNPTPDADPDADLIEELGDLLYQIEFHAAIAEQEGRFTIADVAEGIHDKLVRRHPHVFGDTGPGGANPDGAGADAARVLADWDEIKHAEKGRTSIFDGIPRSMPALSYAAKVGRKASKVGFDWPDVSGALPKVVEETGEMIEAIEARDHVETVAELGDLLFAVVNVARHVAVDPELALRSAADKFRRRFEGVEALARTRSIDLKVAELSTLDELWDEVKRSER
jgi:tetrapyrrole methylase family protein/MazG family protein